MVELLSCVAVESEGTVVESRDGCLSFIIKLIVDLSLPRRVGSHLSSRGSCIHRCYDYLEILKFSYIYKNVTENVVQTCLRAVD